MDFRLPELGEGIESATVVRVLVTPGSAVTAGPDLVALGTDKASMPMPAPSAGTVEKVLVKAGDRVKVGAVIVTVTGSGAAAAPAAKPAAKPAAVPAPAAKPAAPAPAAKV